MKELQSDTSIVILPADKGRSTVILNREDYLEKCMDHINNGPYQLLKKDPTTKIKAKTLKQLKVLKDNEFIDNKLYYYLNPTDLPAPRFYGQPKIHKPGVSIRPKDQVATEDKNNIVYENDCSNCEAVYFGESKRSLKSRSDEHKRSVRNCDCDKNEIAKHCWEADHNFNWDQKKVVDREGRLIPRKIKETIHSLKNPNRINKISYMLPEIWIPNLR